MISDKRTSGLLGQLGNIKNDEEFEKYILKIHLTTILMTKIMHSHFQLITIQFWQKKVFH